MTEYFQYEDLYWPDMQALPRHTHLVLPLGDGYPLELLSSALGEPARVGMLPPFPYGWAGSGVEVNPVLLGRYISNLLDSLRDDGFVNVHALTPQGIDLDWGAARIALPQAMPARHRWLADEQRDKVVLVPIGHTEQHGFHLPLSTDTKIIEAIAINVANGVPEQAVSLPVMPYGVSTHRQAFAGTLNSGGRAFEDFYLDLIGVLAGRGFDRFYLMSGHGGNCSFLVNVIKYAGERHRRIFCATSWLYLSGPEGVNALQQHRTSPIGGMGHAGELETSLMLHLHPHQVHLERAVDELDFVSTPSYYMDWVEGGALIANPPWDDDTRTGAYGAGSLGSSAKGSLWLRAAIDEKISHVSEIHTQHRQREARREAGFGLWGFSQHQSR